MGSIRTVSAVTLGVRDVETSRDFYEHGLGLPVVQHIPGEIAFLQGAPGQLLALWNVASMPDEYGDVAFGPSAPPMSIGHNVATRAEVALLVDALLAAGGTLVNPPTTRDWGGTSACVADPDGFRVDVVHNPAFHVAADGTVTV